MDDKHHMTPPPPVTSESELEANAQSARSYGIYELHVRSSVALPLAARGIGTPLGPLQDCMTLRYVDVGKPQPLSAEARGS